MAADSKYFDEYFYFKVVNLCSKCIDDYEKHKHYIAYHLKILIVKYSLDGITDPASKVINLIADRERLKDYLDDIITKYTEKFPSETRKRQNILDFIRMMQRKPNDPEVEPRIRNLPSSDLVSIAKHFVENNKKRYLGYYQDVIPTCKTKHARQVIHYEDLVNFYERHLNNCPRHDIVTETFPADEVIDISDFTDSIVESGVSSEFIEMLCEWDRYDVYLLIRKAEFGSKFLPWCWINEAMICGRFDILRDAIEMKKLDDDDEVTYTCYRLDGSQHLITPEEFMTGGYFVLD